MSKRLRLVVATVIAAAAVVAACVGDDPGATDGGTDSDTGTRAQTDGSTSPTTDGDTTDGGGTTDAGATDGGTPFDPKSIPNLRLWLDATKGAGTTTTVLNWVDQVTLRAAHGDGTYGLDANTQKCVPPTRVEGEIKGNAVIRFNGTTNCVVMDGDFYDRFQDFRPGFTAFFVTKPGDQVGAGVFESLLDFSPDGSESGDYAVITRRDGRPGYHMANPMTGLESAGANATAFLPGETHMLTVSAIPGDAGAFTTNSVTFFLDGTALTSSSQPSVHVPRVLNRSKSTVGRYVPGNGSPTVNDPGWYRGDIAEILVWFRELTADERNKVHAYLKARWLP